MNKLKLIIGTYNTVPAGETPFLFEQTYQQAFKPFLHAVYNHPEIHATLYYSATLLEWLSKHHPEFPTVLNELMANKSIEILGGAYWEPMLTLIPSSDRIGQIERMITYLRKLFGKRSRGSWISEQIWEPQLASSLHSCGMDYVFLSERIFPQRSDGDIQLPVVGEDQGKTVVIFPVMDSLADQFLKVPPESIIESLHGLMPTDGKDVVISLMLDGLSLGWNGTNSICYDDKWLDRFFRALCDAHSWLECVHPQKYLKNFRHTRDRVYLSGPTYESLMEWSLKDCRPKCPIATPRPQSSYRSFLSRYRESSLLHAKMLHVVILTNQVRSDKYRKKNAREELWRGQEHCAYWHGPTGGIYNSYLRHHAFSALIEAEKITRERGVFKSALTSIDFDMDGEREFLYNGSNYNAYIHPVGGGIFELDYLPIARNYLATCAQYEEEYHPPEIKSQDPYPRYAFMDHVFQSSSEEVTFRQNSYFSRATYTPTEVVRDAPRITLRATGPVDGVENALEIAKTYRFHRSTLEVKYELTNLTHRTLQFSWGSEINLALDEKMEHRNIYLNTDSPSDCASADGGLESQVSSWIIFDNKRNVCIHFSLSSPLRLWWSPVFTNHMVERTLTHAYQSSCFLPHLDLVIPPHASWSIQITMQINRLKKTG